ncbi:hypothetical protein EQ500_03820, partial [Lactobacillus sp. XV13L]|nr:hypothetical protein [Lactobacillus sp. XV13L]
MTTCPNCGQRIADTDEICPKCHFNLQKYRDAFFANEHQQAKHENDETGKRIASRKVYRQEFYPKKQNQVVQKMLEWIHANSMIVFLLGVLLLIIMSFSRSFGWISFFVLLVWLYFVCVRTDKIERYTADRRLTEKVNQVCSNMFNNVEDTTSRGRLASRSREQSR